MNITRYGILGCGGVSERHFRALGRTPGAQVVAVADMDLSMARERAERHGIQHVRGEYQELLKLDSVDAVVICLPNHLHAEAVLAAADAGKHVFVEKPMATSLLDAEAEMDAARRNGVKLCVGESFHYYPEVRKARELIEKGLLGKVFKVVSHVDYYNDYRGERRKWVTAPDVSGNGQLRNMGVHHAAALRALSGGAAQRVYAEVDTLIHKHLHVEDNALCTIRFKNGCLGLISFSLSQRCGLRGDWGCAHLFEVHGSEGSLFFLGTAEGKMELLSTRSPYNGERRTLARQEVLGGNDWWSVWEAFHRDFLASLKDEAPVPVPGQEGYRDLEIIEAAYHSAQCGQPVQLPLLPR